MALTADYMNFKMPSIKQIGVLGREGVVHQTNKMYKAKVAGNGKTKMNDDDVIFINVSEDWLYYWISSSEETIKVKIDGTGRQIVN